MEMHSFTNSIPVLRPSRKTTAELESWTSICPVEWAINLANPCRLSPQASQLSLGIIKKKKTHFQFLGIVFTFAVRSACFAGEIAWSWAMSRKRPKAVENVLYPGRNIPSRVQTFYEVLVTVATSKGTCGIKLYLNSVIMLVCVCMCVCVCVCVCVCECLCVWVCIYVCGVCCVRVLGMFFFNKFILINMQDVRTKTIIHSIEHNKLRPYKV